MTHKHSGTAPRIAMRRVPVGGGPVDYILLHIDMDIYLTRPRVQKGNKGKIIPSPTQNSAVGMVPAPYSIDMVPVPYYPAPPALL